MNSGAESLSWREIKNRLKGSTQKDLLVLLGKCFKVNQDVRIILSMAVSEEGKEKEMIISDLKERLQLAFWDTHKNGCPKGPNLKEAKKVMTMAEKTIDDPKILVDLMLDHLEHGVGFTMEYGDMWEGYYTSIENQFERTCKVIAEHSSEIDLEIAMERIDRQIVKTSNIGWGFEETLDAFREKLIDKLEK